MLGCSESEFIPGWAAGSGRPPSPPPGPSHPQGEERKAGGSGLTPIGLAPRGAQLNAALGKSQFAFTRGARDGQRSRRMLGGKVQTADTACHCLGEYWGSKIVFAKTNPDQGNRN